MSWEDSLKSSIEFPLPLNYSFFFYFLKALSHSPDHKAALTNRQRTAPVVEGLDYKLFKQIDERKDFLKNQIKLDTFETVKKQAYYLHIYHTVR